MNTDDNGQQPITDDAELAKVLEGMNSAAAPATIPTTSGLQFEEAPLPPADTAVATDDSSDDIIAPEPQDLPAPEVPIAPVIPDEPSAPAPVALSGLDAIKKDALEELRPLVDKLNLPAEEKFDTLLLIIRSTDDQSLVTTAHEVAKTIEDETRRAQALLDVIKEIDYFANQQQ